MRICIQFYLGYLPYVNYVGGFPGALVVKNSPTHAGDIRNADSVPGIPLGDKV